MNKGNDWYFKKFVNFFIKNDCMINRYEYCRIFSQVILLRRNF